MYLLARIAHDAYVNPHRWDYTYREIAMVEAAWHFEYVAANRAVRGAWTRTLFTPAGAEEEVIARLVARPGVCCCCVKRPISPDEWIVLMVGGAVLLIAFLLWLFLKGPLA